MLMAPEKGELSGDFLPIGDGTVGSTFASRLVVLAVAGQIEDLCENLLLKECDMCDMATDCCSVGQGDGTADAASGTTLGVI